MRPHPSTTSYSADHRQRLPRRYVPTSPPPRPQCQPGTTATSPCAHTHAVKAHIPPGHQRTRNILLPFHLSGRRRPTTSAATPGTGPAVWVPCHAHSPHSANPSVANDKRHCAPCHAQPTLPRKSIHCQHSPVCQVARFSAPSSAGMGSERVWA